MSSNRDSKRWLGLVLASILLWSCGQREQRVEKTTENGVEIVNNHLEPYKISGEPVGLRVEEEFTIDPEREDLARLGLMEIRSFDIDSNWARVRGKSSFRLTRESTAATKFLSGTQEP